MQKKRTKGRCCKSKDQKDRTQSHDKEQRCNDRAAAFYKKAGWRVVKEEVYPVETSGGEQSVTIWRFEKDLA